MASDRGHRELKELLGAYALDAVEPNERADLDAHLLECPTCRAEVAEHRETAATLAVSAGAAPDKLWARIDAELEPERAAPNVVPLPSTRRRSWTRAIASVAAAAMIGVLGLTVVRQDHRLDRLTEAVGEERVVRAANDALLHPERRVLQLEGQGGTVDVVMLPDGSGFVVRDTLPALPESRTYQLWALQGETAVSAGVLGPDPDVRPFSIDPTAEVLAVTAEPRGGARKPSTRPLALGKISIA